jgi:hypothetical protein
VNGDRWHLRELAAELSAEHGLLNDHKGAGDRNPLVFAMMAQFTGSADYHVPSARDEPPTDHRTLPRHSRVERLALDRQNPEGEHADGDDGDRDQIGAGDASVGGVLTHENAVAGDPIHEPQQRE